MIENEKIAYRVQGMPAAARNIVGSFILRPTEAGTEITITTDYEMPWSILGKVIDKLIGQRMLEKDTVRTLEKMKNILEK